MSGHSKWATIKHQKGVADARRGQLFTKLTREIIVAARQGGANPDMNVRLRLAIQKARDNNMPLDNIERAIKRAVGGQDAASLTEMTLEGYGPNGVAIMVEAMTDNRNRTVAEVRSVFSKHGGSMGESGCVSWMFESKGIITVEVSNQEAEELELIAIDAGAADFKEEGSYLEIYTDPANLEKVREAIEKHKPIDSAEISLIPANTMMLDEKHALQTLKLLDHLEELDDVQRVSSNADFSDEIMEKLREQA